MKSILLSIYLSLHLTSVSAQGKAENEVAAAIEQLRTAMINADKAALDHITAAQLSYGHSSGNLDDKKIFIEKLVSGQSDFVTIDLINQTINVSGNTAIVRHILNAKTNDGGKSGEVHLRVLLVWQKQKGHWKLLARQAVRMN